MFKQIEFIAQNEKIWNTYEKPKPASQFIPSWWKQMESSINTESGVVNGTYNSTVKKCMPTFDIFSSGYIVSLPCDIVVSIDKFGDHHVKWFITSEIIHTWNNDQVSTFEIDQEYDTKPVFKNMHGWTIKTPPGWSSYITHPVAYPNLPFRSISGIVDTDLLSYEINTPFTFKKNWTGILEKGTPMFQIIPFERSSWKAEYSFRTEQEHSYQRDILYSKIKNAYGKYFREKKSFI
jgi:hypothetical protein